MKIELKIYLCPTYTFGLITFKPTSDNIEKLLYIDARITMRMHENITKIENYCIQAFLNEMNY